MANIYVKLTNDHGVSKSQIAESMLKLDIFNAAREQVATVWIAKEGTGVIIRTESNKPISANQAQGAKQP